MSDNLNIRQAAMMDSDTPNISILGGLLTIIGILIGWVAGVFKAAWTLSKFESRVLGLEKFKFEYEEENMSERLHTMENIARKLETVPSLMQDLGKTVNAIDKIIFLERGGLNVVTIQEHERMQLHCQSMFKKDLEHIKLMVEQIVQHTGAGELKRIAESISSMEEALKAHGITNHRKGN